MLRIISKNSRTLNLQKNVILSFVLKGISIGISLLLVPLTLNYLESERYGLWLTLSSIIGWAALFDIGLGNGFRNKFAEAIAVKNDSLAKTYVSTTFALLNIIIVGVLIVFFVINRFIDWGVILNTVAESSHTLSLLVIITFTFFAIRFVLQITTSIFLADQRSALVDLVNMLGSLLSLIVIFLLLRFGEPSLLYFGLAFSACPVIVLVATYFFTFAGKYAKYKPSLKYIDFKQSKSLMGLGIMFFIPQICSLIIFSTSNVIVTQLFSPSDVTVYNIAFKYFSVVTLFFNIILSPSWSAYTEAFVKKDIVWIKSMIRKMILICAVFCFGTLLMAILANPVYKLWVGESIVVPVSLTTGMALYVSILNWNNIFAQFNAGVSKIYIQVWLSLFGGIVFIPLAILISKNAGLIGIPLAMILSILPGTFIQPVQSGKIINGKAKGIWNK